MVKLTEEAIVRASKGATPSSITKLSLSNSGLVEVSRLKALAKLERLDLSHNRLHSIEALSNCKSLKWLSVASNELKSLRGVESLSNLMVLNGSTNQLMSMKEVEGLVELRALILNDNQINSICKLRELTALNTLVLSKNPICRIETSLEKVSSLIKLSLSNCELQDLGSLKCLVDLKELRLAHNKIKYLSNALRKNVQLRIVDLGNNALKDISDIEVLSNLHFLKNVNVRGNPFCSQSDYQDKVNRMLPYLHILDGHVLQSTSKKRPSKDHSVEAERTEEEEGLHTHKKLKRVKKAVGDRDGSMEYSIPEKSLLTFGKLKQGQKVNKAPRDQEGSMHEESFHSLCKAKQGQKGKKKAASVEEDIIAENITGNHKSYMKSDKNVGKESLRDEDKPFMELISQKEPADTRVSKKLSGSSKPTKNISGVVSLVDNKGKLSKQKNKHNTKPTCVFSVSLEDVDVGAGGVSSWTLEDHYPDQTLMSFRGNFCTNLVATSKGPGF